MAELLLPTVGLKNEGSRRLSTDQRVKNFTPNSGIAFSVKPSDNLKDGIAIADTIEKYQLAIKAEKERALVNEAISLYQEDLGNIETNYYNTKTDNAVKGFEDYQKSIKNLETKYGSVFKDSRMQSALNSRMSDYAVQARVNGRNHHDKEVQAKSILELEGRVSKSVEHYWLNAGSPFDQQNHEEMLANVQAFIAETKGLTDPTSDAYRLESKKIFDKAFYGPIRAMISRDPQRALVYLDKVKGDISDMGYAQFVEMAKDKIETNAIRAEQRAELAERRREREEARQTAENERLWKERTQPLTSSRIAQIYQGNLTRIQNEYESNGVVADLKDENLDPKIKFALLRQAYSETLKQVNAINSERKAYKDDSTLAEALINTTYHQLMSMGTDANGASLVAEFKNDPMKFFSSQDRSIIESVLGTESDTYQTLNDKINKMVLQNVTDSTYSYEKNIVQMSQTDLLNLDLEEVYRKVSPQFVPVLNKLIANARKNAQEGKIENGNKEINDLIFMESFDLESKDRKKDDNLFKSLITNDIYNGMMQAMRIEATDKNGNVDLSKLSPLRQQMYWYAYKNTPRVRAQIEAVNNYQKTIDEFYNTYRESLTVNRDKEQAKADIGKVVSDYFYKHNYTLPSQNQLYEEITRLDREKYDEAMKIKKANPVSDIGQLLLYFGDPYLKDASFENELYWEHNPMYRAKNYAPENTLSTDERWRED